MHYRTNCCGNDAKEIKLSFSDDLSRLIESYILQMFEKRKVTAKNRKALFKLYQQQLTEALQKGFNTTMEHYSADLAKQLTANIAEFSAFKEGAFKNTLEKLLVKNGELVAWPEFKQMASALNVEYNLRYLKTEYSQTVAAANSAEKYLGYLQDQDLYPNLRYIAVLDSRVRDQHRDWNGLVLPVTHEFWTKHLPPNDWGCRCSVEQTDDPVSTFVPSISDKELFANNPAVSGKIFAKNGYEQNMTQDEREQVMEQLKKWGKG